MHILIVSDLEGVGGVLNFSDWCVAEGRRNEVACQYLTEEVNAAVEGFFMGGASSVTVFDGHGAGGSIRGEKLDPRAALQRGRMNYPIFNDRADAIAFVGLHAKAGTANAHLAHTQTEEAVDFRLNGVSIGEFGQTAYAYSELNIPSILAVGDKAMTLEARALVPDICTVAVKEGFNAALGMDCSADDLFLRESAALHYPRTQVLAAICSNARKAVEMLQNQPGSFAIKPLPGQQYSAEAEYRQTSRRLLAEVGDYPARRIRTSMCPTIAEALHEFYTRREWCAIDNEFITAL